jgi:hypothetical protein
MFENKVSSFIILIAVEDGTSQVFTGLYQNYEAALKTRVEEYRQSISL